MSSDGTRTAHAGPDGASALDRLLSAEREIAARAASAERDAAATIESARADAGAVEREAEAALDAELASREARAGLERETLARRIEDEGTRLVARYRALNDGEAARLARFVVAEVTGLQPETGT